MDDGLDLLTGHLAEHAADLLTQIFEQKENCSLTN